MICRPKYDKLVMNKKDPAFGSTYMLKIQQKKI